MRRTAVFKTVDWMIEHQSRSPRSAPKQNQLWNGSSGHRLRYLRYFGTSVLRYSGTSVLRYLAIGFRPAGTRQLRLDSILVPLARPCIAGSPLALLRGWATCYFVSGVARTPNIRPREYCFIIRVSFDTRLRIVPPD